MYGNESGPQQKWLCWEEQCPFSKTTCTMRGCTCVCVYVRQIVDKKSLMFNVYDTVSLRNSEHADSALPLYHQLRLAVTSLFFSPGLFFVCQNKIISFNKK